MELLQKAIVRLLKRRPFYGHLLLGFRRESLPNGSGAGVTLRGGRPVLQLSERDFGNWSAQEQEALLEHLVKHLLHLHMVRGRKENRQTWSLACDLAINPGIAGLPLTASYPQRFRLEEGLSAEEYCRELSRRFDTGNLEGEGAGNASQDRGGATGAGQGEESVQQPFTEPVDNHEIWETAESTPLRLAETVVRQHVKDALRHCRGEVPGELKKVVAGILRISPIPWPQILRQFVATAGRIGRRGTWKREHRRFAHQTPGIRKHRKLHLLVGVDVSDSTDLRPLREAFAGELLRIAKGRHARLTVLYAGSRIHRIDRFTSAPQVQEVYEGGGFTDLRPVFDYAKTMNPLPAAVIYLTDGFGPAPETMPLPTLWVLTKDGEKPVDWGVELRLEEA